MYGESMKKIVDMEEWEAFYAEQMKGIDPYNHYDNGYEDAIDKVDAWLEEQTVADVAEVECAKWIHDDSGLFCSWCRNNALHDKMTGASVVSPFCPHCGAKMSEETEPRSYGGNGGASGTRAVAAVEDEKNLVWVYDGKEYGACPGSGGNTSGNFLKTKE